MNQKQENTVRIFRPTDEHHLMMVEELFEDRDQLQANGLGEWLVHKGLISRSELFHGLSLAYQRCCRIGDALVTLRMIDRADIEKEAKEFVHMSGLISAPSA